MKIHINEVPPEGMDIEEELVPADLNLETEQIHHSGKIKAKAHVSKDRDILTVNCDISSTETQVCSRCLKEFDFNFSKRVDFIYKLKGEHTIVLDDNIRDEIILDYPLRMLCKSDCKGLCPKCGKDLNQGPCTCSQEPQAQGPKLDIKI